MPAPTERSTVSLWAPGPSIRTLLRSGNGLLSWISPKRLVLSTPGAKAMVSSPAALFASIIAWRREPAPASLVLVTVKVDAHAAGGANANMPNTVTTITHILRTALFLIDFFSFLKVEVFTFRWNYGAREVGSTSSELPK